MRGGLERWKRGSDSRGIRHAVSYAFDGACDAYLPHSSGFDALENYSGAGEFSVARFVVDDGEITADELSSGGVRNWVAGYDPVTGEQRGISLPRLSF